MKQRVEFLSLAIPLLVSVAALVAQVENPSPQDQPQAGSASTGQQPSDDQLVEHGKYLVQHVAMCVKCHSPKEADGTIVEKQILSGGKIPVENPFPNQAWALRAPSLRGLPGGWGKQDLVHFLRTGQPPTEHQIRLPMPPFRMNQRDAEAVAVYLQSLAE